MQFPPSRSEGLFYVVAEFARESHPFRFTGVGKWRAVFSVGLLTRGDGRGRRGRL
jgi:hypothetical protein